VTFLLDHFILPIDLTLSNPAWHHCRSSRGDHFSLQKCRNIRDFYFDSWKIFWGQPPGPDPHNGEGLRRPSPDPTTLGATALRASAHAPRSGPSIDGLESAPPSQSPGYATASRGVTLFQKVGDRFSFRLEVWGPIDRGAERCGCGEAIPLHVRGRVTERGCAYPENFSLLTVEKAHFGGYLMHSGVLILKL